MVNNTTSIDLTDDSIDAMIFIIVVLFWYSSSIVFLMAMEIGGSNERLDDAGGRPSKLFVQNLREHSNNTEVLKELVDKQKRDKLWDIYLGTSGDMSDKISRAEALRIRHIEKRLASLNDDRQGSQPVTPDDDPFRRPHSHLWSSVVDMSSSTSRLRTRRRSSLDYKILQEWKTLANDLKTHENWPWAIQKLLIRRHLRRQRHPADC